MSDHAIETNKALVRRIPTELFDEGNSDLVDEPFAVDFVGHVPPTPGDLQGPGGFNRLVTAFRTGFPDRSHPEISLVGEGDTVVAWLNATGTHEGEFVDIEPTGRRMDGTALELSRLDSGEITEAWLNVDMQGLLKQLGAVQEV